VLHVRSAYLRTREEETVMNQHLKGGGDDTQEHDTLEESRKV
jgi:hypothetical protein